MDRKAIIYRRSDGKRRGRTRQRPPKVELKGEEEEEVREGEDVLEGQRRDEDEIGGGG